MNVLSNFNVKEADKEVKAINASFYCEWWVVKTVGTVVIVLLLAVLAEASVILWLLPLKETKPYLISGYNKDSQVIKVEPIEKNTQGLSILMGMLSAEFVVDLHTIDGVTEEARFKKLSLMASSETIDFIETQLNVVSSNSVAKKVLESGVTRSVNIKGVTNLAPDAPNTWQVEWEAIEKDSNTEAQRRNAFISTIMAEPQEKV
ncbi:MAG TPA: VirB8/TrbF family protein, partial [Gammaproteobacteria bacterium]|nr:VirB8/TrbF family protein [Gammaproteobacteria bacterium]